MKKLRTGYVGAGFMAQKVHIPNIQQTEECDLRALAEIRPELGRKVQARFGIPKLFHSHAELGKDPDIQAVAVSGHFAGQGEIAIDLLRAGKDVFMEKPMAVSSAQADRILAAERETGHRVMIGYMKRYDAGNVYVRKLLDKVRATGELGRLQFVRNHGFCGDWTAGLDTPMDTSSEPLPPGPALFPDWLPKEWQNGYLGYLQQYTHNINLLRWFLDAGDNVKITAVDLDRANGVNGIIVLEVGGVRATIESGWVTYHGWDEHTQLYFEKGWVRTSAPPLLLRNEPASVEVYRGGEESTRSEIFPAEGRSWSYKAEMRHFAQSVLTGTPFRSPAADAAVDVRFFEEIYRRFLGLQA